MTPASSPAAPLEATVRLVGRTHAPDHVTVASGGTVGWVWVPDGHSLLSDGPQFFASQDEFWPGGSTYTVQFDTVGTYHFRCGVHAGMGGTVTAVEPA